MTEHGVRFRSRLGLLLSVLGIAVGTGNIWRFPRIAASVAGPNGAGAFLIAWCVCLFAWSVPLIILEYALGRRARAAPAAAAARLAGAQWAAPGAFVAWVATAILFYYAVVTGWCFFYLFQVSCNGLPSDPSDALDVWKTFQDSYLPLGLQIFALVCGGYVVVRGVSAIETVNRVLIPALLVVVLVSLIRSVTLPRAGEGLLFLFGTDISDLAQPKLWLEALTQNTWDTGAGWGLILCYATYMRSQDGIVSSALTTAVINNAVSLLAAMTIFGTVFALSSSTGQLPDELLRESGPAATGLTFVWMPLLFAKIGGGVLLAPLFFLGLSFAALSSLISMIELATRTLIDAGLTRRRAVAATIMGSAALGAPSAINLTVLQNQDFVWGLALLLCGLILARLGATHGLPRLRESMSGNRADRDPTALWSWWVRYAIPILATSLLVWWLMRTVTEYAPATWWNPIDPFSLATCVLQWSLAFTLIYGLRRWLTDSLDGQEPPVQAGSQD